MGARCGILTMPTLAQASTGEAGTIIETFVVRQFPNAAGHYWVSNETPWGGDEMIVDLQTIVNERRATEFTISYFLLLIVQKSSEESCVSRSSQELTAEPKKRYTRSSSPPIYYCHCVKKPPPSPLYRREGDGHSHPPRTIT